MRHLFYSSGVGREHPELRRHVQLAFTLSELRQLAVDWGLETSDGWDASAEDAARLVVKQAERSMGTNELLRRLKRKKPLVEWPDAEQDDSQWQPLGSPDARDGNTLVDVPLSAHGLDVSAKKPIAPTLTDLGDLSAEPGPISVGPSSLSPGSQSPNSLSPASGSPSPSSQSPSSLSPPLSAPMSNPWTAPPPKEKAEVSSKLILMIVALALTTVGLAFAAGLLWQARSSPSATGNEATPNPNGLSGRAISLFEDSLVDVAQRCKLTKVSGFTPVEILGAAQDSCGLSLPSPRREQGDDIEAFEREPTGKRRAPREREAASPTIAPVQRDPTSGGKTCAANCAKQKTSCKASCGSEPSDASQYDTWQACTSKCYAGESRCRTSCH